tara:strand:- start:36 stop:344 length:309 start_codon:yes stop_codon:yes gene_type:complete
MKTLNKKNLKIINEFLFTMRTNDNCRNDIEKQDVQTDEEKAFADYLYWDTKVVSIELYENYGIYYFSPSLTASNVSEKEAIISQKETSTSNWRIEWKKRGVA